MNDCFSRMHRLLSHGTQMEVFRPSSEPVPEPSQQGRSFSIARELLSSRRSRIKSKNGDMLLLLHEKLNGYQVLIQTGIKSYSISHPYSRHMRFVGGRNLCSSPAQKIGFERTKYLINDLIIVALSLALYILGCLCRRLWDSCS